MPKRPVTREELEQLRKLRAAGHSLRECARRMKRGFTVIHRWDKELLRGGKEMKNGSEPPPPLEADGTASDNTAVDGTVTVVRAAKPMTPAEIKELVGLDDGWEFGPAETGVWEGFYKVKNYLPRPVLKEIVKMVRDGADVQELYDHLVTLPAGHEKVKMTTTRVKFRPVLDLQVQDCLKSWIEKHGGKPLPKPKNRRKPKKAELLVNYGDYDTHFGMYSWAKETGHDWDVECATTRVLNSIDEMVDRLHSLPPIGTILNPTGNDLGHFDSVRQQTARGDHQLDVDTRFPRVFDAAMCCQAYRIERLKEVCNLIKVIWVPGNHDYSMSYGIWRALQQRFRKWPNVQFVEDVRKRKYEYHGGCVIGFDHGQLKPESYSSIMLNECRGHLDGATYLEMNTGHTHQPKQLIIKSSVPAQGVFVRTHPSLCPPDAWHYERAFLGAYVKSVEALYYDRTGRVGDLVVHANDDTRRSVDALTKEVL